MSKRYKGSRPLPTLEELRAIDPDFPDVPTGMVEEDTDPMESAWHRAEKNLLIESVKCLYQGVRDYYVGGGQFIYYCDKQVADRSFRGADFFFARRVPPYPLRDYWAAWEETGRGPDMAIELLSPATAHLDRTHKFEVYENTFRITELFHYDPEKEHLEGWRHDHRSLKPIERSDQDRLWCATLKLWLGKWNGLYQGDEAVWLRFFDPQGNVVPTFAEVERRRVDALQAELTHLRGLTPPSA